MKDKNLIRFRLPPVVIKLNDISTGETPVPPRIQLLRTGTFTDPRYNTFKITPVHLSEMKKNFDAKVRGIDIAIDYSHDNQDEAAGWIQELTLEEHDGETQLWATVKWTKAAELCLSDKEYRYVSAEFMLDYVDNETQKHYGPCLLGAGLTNRPVIKEMNPVIELQEGKGKKMANDSKKVPPGKEDISDEDKDKKIAEMEEKLAEYAEKEKLAEGTSKGKKGNPSDGGKDTEGDDKGVEGEGDGEDSTDDDGDDVAGLKKKMAKMSAKLAAYEASSKEMSEKMVLTEKKAKFALMMSEGKAVKAQEKAYLAGDLDQFAALQQPIKLGKTGHSREDAVGGGTMKLSDQPAQAEAMKLAEDKMASKKDLAIGDALSLVLKENPDLYRRYAAETTHSA